MPVERTQGGTSLIDVLDRVLDKGIVIDAWVRVSLVGIDRGRPQCARNPVAELEWRSPSLGGACVVFKSVAAQIDVRR